MVTQQRGRAGCVCAHQGLPPEGLGLWAAEAAADPKQSLGFEFWQHKGRRGAGKMAPGARAPSTKPDMSSVPRTHMEEGNQLQVFL